MSYFKNLDLENQQAANVEKIVHYLRSLDYLSGYEIKDYLDGIKHIDVLLHSDDLEFFYATF
jgi:hypothetical protein